MFDRRTLAITAVCLCGFAPAALAAAPKPIASVQPPVIAQTAKQQASKPVERFKPVTRLGTRPSNAPVAKPLDPNAPIGASVNGGIAAQASRYGGTAPVKRTPPRTTTNDLQIKQAAAERADARADEQVKSQKEHIQNLKDNYKRLLDMWSGMAQSTTNSYR